MKIARVFCYVAIILTILFSPSLEAENFINEELLKTVNTEGDEIFCTFTRDTKTFIFTRRQKNSQYSHLYQSEYRNGKWSQPKEMQDVNSDSDDISPYISPDGGYMLFASNRYGGLKNSSTQKPSYDVYYTEKNRNGWDKPVLLFGTVNTSADEMNPFITDDGRILYITRIQPEENAKPRIIEIRKKTEYWEDQSSLQAGFMKPLIPFMYKKSSYRNGAFITAYKDESKTRDIYFINTYDNSVTDLNTWQAGINTPGDEISVTEVSPDAIIISTNTDTISGSYDFALKKIPTGGKAVFTRPDMFSINVKSENYTSPDGIKIRLLFFNTLRTDTPPVRVEEATPDVNGLIRVDPESGIKRIVAIPGSSDMKEFAYEYFPWASYNPNTVITVEPASEQTLQKKSVYFSTNSSEIHLADIPYLHRMIDYMRANPDAVLTLDGYADGTGGNRADVELSLRRAESVKKYLVKMGIKRSRIQIRANGFIKPDVYNTQQQGRRVDFTVSE